MCRDWDSILVNYAQVYTGVITTKLLNSQENIFMTVDSLEKSKIQIGHRKLHKFYNRPILSVVWSADFSFQRGDLVSHVLSDDTDLGVSATLLYNKINIFSPGQCIAVRAKHPSGVRQRTTSIVSPKVIDVFKKYHDIHENELSAHIKNGLCNHFSADDSIQKYGSIWQANLLVANSG